MDEGRGSRLAARRARRAARRGGDGWVGGAVLMAIGAVLLLQRAGAVAFDNWWALIILIPGLAGLVNAWRACQDEGTLAGPAGGALGGALVLIAVAVAFLLNWDWGWFGPVLLLAVGAGILLRGFARPQDADATDDTTPEA